ncbi:acetate--CoA ligase family protein [Candidatus Spongiihabitans sp.]|uniref:acetate--CoA ligase family protein n=1 Tax=Candidatus Spongiihabitans sp. TaxID=3101308 RepID=UPI003C6EBADD
MNKKQRQNLARLLAPRHIAFIGGADADYAAGQCAASFNGPVWGVNPKRTHLGGQICYPSTRDLPEAPDAVFLAIPREATIQALKDLNEMGTGGVACFTAGFGELGEVGKQAEKALVAAAGEVALVGPNCYGVISYVNDAILWPFAAGAGKFGVGKCEKGIALIMQSGMIAANLAINQRSAPLAYVISAGNQAMLAIEDYIDMLVDDPKVSAIGIYMEGIVSVERFAASATKALQANKPIVVLKAGRSAIGAQLTVSHTGSLSGADEAHQALFDQLGVVRVDAPETLLETLKFMAISGMPSGNRIAAFSCSGGDALMVADYCERKNLELPQHSKSATAKLTALLPDIATVSNPLDYTTPLWGNTEVMPKVFSAALKDGFDAAIFIQDYFSHDDATEHIQVDNSSYVADAKSYIGAVNEAGIPAAICSDLSENIDQGSREMMVRFGVTPLQGIDRGLDAIFNACVYSVNRSRILKNKHKKSLRVIQATGSSAGLDQGKVRLLNARLLNEWDSKQQLKAFGLSVPEGALIAVDTLADGPDIAEKIGFPVAIKLVSEQLTHKSDVDVVALNLKTKHDVERGLAKINTAIKSSNIDCEIQGYLIESMVENVIHELLVGVKQDPQFGLVMVIASGGVWVELIKDAQTLLLPTNENTVKHVLSNLKCCPLLRGYRGRPKCDMDSLVKTIIGLAEFAEANADRLIEMDINPLMVLPDGAVAADALLRITA